MKRIKRPLKTRIWYMKGDSWQGPWLFKGDDEYHYKTQVIGTPLTGFLVIAYRKFNRNDCDGFCDDLFDLGYPGWPVDVNTFMWGDEPLDWEDLTP